MNINALKALVSSRKFALVVIVAIVGSVGVATGKLSWDAFLTSLTVISGAVVGGIAYEDGQAKGAL